MTSTSRIGTSPDVRAKGGRIVELGQRLSSHGEPVLDARGGTSIPGLHDHHVHLFALAAALDSVSCGPPSVHSHPELAEALIQAARTSEPGTWIRGTGYHEAVAGPLNRWILDDIVNDRPVRVQHRSGKLWILNSVGAECLGLDWESPAGAEVDESGRLTGRLYRADSWLRSRLGSSPMDLAAVSELLSSYGVTGVTDATPDLSAESVSGLEHSVRDRTLRQRLVALGAPTGGSSLTTGPLKIVVEEAVGLDLGNLAERVRATHDDGRAVAIHCVTRAEVVVAVAAIDQAGALPGDRLEHASELPSDLVPRIRDLGLCIVTQPNFIAERGDAYLSHGESSDAGCLYPLGGPLSAGVLVAGGTDAPFGSADPWAAVCAAAERRTASGRYLGPSERVDPEVALRLFGGDPLAPGAHHRDLAVGDPADICVLDRSLVDVLAAPSRDHVLATVIGGHVTYRRAG